MDRDLNFLPLTLVLSFTCLTFLPFLAHSFSFSLFDVRIFCFSFNTFFPLISPFSSIFLFCPLFSQISFIFLVSRFCPLFAFLPLPLYFCLFTFAFSNSLTFAYVIAALYTSQVHIRLPRHYFPIFVSVRGPIYLPQLHISSHYPFLSYYLCFFFSCICIFLIPK